jgi:Chemotaxis signal transduction protein
MERSTNQQYLSFSLDGERYAVRIEKVHEVLEYTRITSLPRMADFMKGIINLRGTGIPVIDLRLRFGMLETPIGKDTAIIVMEIEGEDGNIVVGTLADAVHEVIELADSAIEPPPSFGSNLVIDYISGIGKNDGRFIVVLDIDRILEAEEYRFSTEPGETAMSEVPAAEVLG